ncbi:2Fe-2S iron-sulfur cluster binding domain-containing protein [Methylobacterium sp. C25]|nr:2Fe-2S iron-sulfur cluster binding domain-containing protein [Methylobacterium sp. C25]
MTTISSNRTGTSSSNLRTDEDVIDQVVRPSNDTCLVEVQSKAGLTAFACSKNESLLLAGLRQGLTLPYECASGTCGSCRARLDSGDVANCWPDAPGHMKIKPAKGDILMCQSRPLGDCSLRVPANVVEGFARYELPTHHNGRIERLDRLTSDVIHFDVVLAEPMSFDAGQFVLLQIPGLEGMRAYSMVNYERRTRRLSLVVKRKPGGGFGDWLFERAAAADKIDVFGPLGSATFHPDEGHDLLMVAGGSGIAGMMSILERATNEGHFESHRGHVFFGVRTVDDCFYLDKFSRYVDRARGNLEVTIALSDAPPQGPVEGAHPDIRFATGLVHEVCGRDMQGRFSDRMMSYLAGPPPMVDGALRTLIGTGKVTPDRIRYDKFG